MTSQPNLIPRQPKKLRTASKDVLREQLVLAIDALITERLARVPWWRRAWYWIRGTT